MSSFRQQLQSIVWRNHQNNNNYLDYIPIVVLGIVSVWMYRRILQWTQQQQQQRRPSPPPPIVVSTSTTSTTIQVTEEHPPPNSNDTTTIMTNHTNRTNHTNPIQHSSTPTTNPNTSTTSTISLLPRVPLHLSYESHCVATTNGSNVLQSSDGCIAFTHTRSSSSTATCTNPQTTKECQRRDRATLWSHILSSVVFVVSSSSNTVTTIVPPKRGSTIIVSIPIHTVSCPHQRYVLWLLGTYYNTYIILVLPSSSTTSTLSQQTQLRMDAMTTLRGPTTTTDNNNNNDNASIPNIHLSTEILPSHRIIATSTTEGRIAFIRQQLSRPALPSTTTTHHPTLPYLILEYDTTVQSILQRFGYHAIRMYDADHPTRDTTTTTISGLGRMILGCVRGSP